MVTVATEALAAATAVTEEGSEVEGGGILGETVAVVTVAVVTASGTAVVAIATTEEDRNAASARRLIIEVPTCGLTVTHLGWQ